jgi:hypothetical protein
MNQVQLLKLERLSENNSEDFQPVGVGQGECGAKGDLGNGGEYVDQDVAYGWQAEYLIDSRLWPVTLDERVHIKRGAKKTWETTRWHQRKYADLGLRNT